MGSFTIKNLTFSYPEQDQKVLDNLSCKIRDGEFIVVSGPSGSGKTTFLRQLKPTLTPHGKKSGTIYFKNDRLETLNQREESLKIGFVLQNPDNQIVTDKVWHELAFGLENLGYDTPTIRLRVAEMASFFGIQSWFYKDVTELSGGQKQMLNLASVMAMQPSVLILDEPTSQLDPIAASNFLETVQKINRELGTTVILTEHRLEEALPMANRVIVMDKGKIITDDEPKKVAQTLGENNHKMFLAMPIPTRIYASIANELDPPITVREGRQWLNDFSKENELQQINKKNNQSRDSNLKATVEIEEAWFKYEKNFPDIIKGASIKAYPGELLAILGGNGTGKSTLLSLISGINHPYRGKIKIKEKELHTFSDREIYNGLLGVLPQNPQALFVKKTVELDLYEMFKGHKVSNEEQKNRVSKVSKICDISSLMEHHPFDLSGGEQQRVGLAKILLLEPEILLLDEPTKGMDAEFKEKFSMIIKNLLIQGVTVIMVSHDIEFCAKYANYCALFFDGSVISHSTTREFFSGNNFYTTAANRMSRQLLPEAITPEDVIQSCGGEVKTDEAELFDETLYNLKAKNSYGEDKSEIPRDRGKFKSYFSSKIKRRFIALVSLIILIFTIKRGYPLISQFAWDGVKNEAILSLRGNEEVWQYVTLVLLFVMSGGTFILSIFKRDRESYQATIQVPQEKRKLSKRTKIATVLILFLIPLTIYIGVYYLGDRKYYFISLLIILETMLPFVMVFEDREPQARELVIIAVLSALGVAGRIAFFMVPQFKPVAAIVIVSAVAFGGESGFLVGTMTMFLSNMLYSQGPWTPWQMFAMGVIGFLAGILFRKGFLRRDKLSLATFGALATFFIYGGIMNPASVIMYQSNITWPMIATAYITGAPFDLIHAAATFFFLLVIGETMLEKLDRIKVKFGLME
jgi:energy-coupling factor transport system ATP-binding protein